MNDSENEEYVSTPERKRAYIQRWLLENPHETAKFDSDLNDRTPPSSPRHREKSTASFAHPLSPVLAQKLSSPCAITRSPILGGKRLATSPIIGGRRRSIKRSKVAKKLDTTYIKKKTDSDSKLQTVLQSTTHADPQDHSNEDIFENNTTVASTVKAIESDLNFTFDDSKSTKQNNIKINKQFRMVRKPLDDTISQLIESTSSTEDTSTENAEQNILEASSDTDKTKSDLIEDISTQEVLVMPDKPCEMPASQKISNPSSTPSPKFETDVFISETLTDQIDTVSSLDSRIDFGKTSYIIEHKTEEQSRKTYKKGGLLDTLLTTMAKEKSNVNLWRYNVCKKDMSGVFILLQIVEHLPKLNKLQLLKCILIEDSTDLLSGLLKENRFISVINVPEISGLIKTNEKPVLKVYKPWTIIDPNQQILHITRFIAIPPNSENCTLVNENLFKKDLKTDEEFHCPCIDENSLSNKCEMKFHDSSYNMVESVFNYVKK
ncbi:uncharacterized protein LOC100678048 [Nasonia vitripennis]|uniref:Uncharacterized protein n=1 Tax=Nasonia vitripennis TaxID=7425 RepID=A0A7M7GDN0_NASVI|nr:uncharacterized protein LOC100678048 [Nasonia vitripennis]